MAHESEHLSENTIMLFIFSVLEFAKSHNLNVHKYDRARKSGAKFILLSYIFLKFKSEKNFQTFRPFGPASDRRKISRQIAQAAQNHNGASLHTDAIITKN